ncbi:hypothetical protein [Carboxylicivirga marina]|uniref:Long-chain fatty acid transport protein n=2 Tax=Carboxylicivirga marina TaxID=2800988 RepID=A0ABS1HLQ3_9BACT|nr:hypothetical protein [Carboxylicivirga marina]MBK3518089.1 hypothetical protein [Carboxylicivirga marina]
MRVGFLVITVLVAVVAKSQDAHYWTEQYGTSSMLLSNSVFGSVEDLGAVYYNPARLSFIEDNAFLISGKVYQYSSYKFETTTDTERTSPQKQSAFGGAPSLLAGTYRIKGLDKQSFAYSFLGRRRMDINIIESNSAYGNVLPSIPGEEHFSGDVILQKKFNEEWLGLSWAYGPNDRFSIGVTNFLTIRKQQAADEMQIKVYTESEDVETFSNHNSYQFSHMGLLWKIGLAWHLNPVSWGVTITTPTVSLSGDGAFLYERVYTGIYDSNPVYELNGQRKLETTYKTPFSIAGGLGIKLKRGSLHASAEYFGPVKEYTLMSGVPFEGQSTGEVYQAYLIDELNPVLNFGIGYNFVLSDEIVGYLSYSTDFSAAVAGLNDDSGFRAVSYSSTFNSDINHFGGGVELHLKRVDITFGATYSTTKYTLERPISFPPSGGNGLLETGAQTDIRWNRWRFIIGISIPFLTDFAKKWEEKLFNKEETSN